MAIRHAVDAFQTLYGRLPKWVSADNRATITEASARLGSELAEDEMVEILSDRFTLNAMQRAAEAAHLRFEAAQQRILGRPASPQELAGDSPADLERESSERLAQEPPV